MAFVGQTKRALKWCVTEHESAVCNKKEDYSIAHHYMKVNPKSAGQYRTWVSDWWFFLGFILMNYFGMIDRCTCLKSSVIFAVCDSTATHTTKWAWKWSNTKWTRTSVCSDVTAEISLEKMLINMQQRSLARIKPGTLQLCFLTTMDALDMRFFFFCLIELLFWGVGFSAYSTVRSVGSLPKLFRFI